MRHAFLALGLIAGSTTLELRADVHPLRAVLPVCTAESCRLGMAYGSAVSIGRAADGQELFLTAAHCVAGKTQRLEVGIAGNWHLARVLARSEQPTDLAVLGVAYSGPVIQAALLANTPATPGTEVTLTGFPAGQAFRRHIGIVVPHRFTHVELVIDQPSQPGESGGGLFNQRGELVGIVSATFPAEQPTHTLAEGLTRIRQLLTNTFPAKPSCQPLPVPTFPISEPAANLSELQSELESLKAKLAELEARSQQPGPPGPRGPQGHPGTTDATILKRLERLEQIEIPVQILTPDGQLIDEARYRLGQPLQFRLIPRK